MGMKDMEQAVATAFANVVASGAIEQAIEKQIGETINSAIKDHLRSYSDFGKAISEQVQQAIGVRLERLDLPSYNDLILKIVRAQIEGAMHGETAKQIEANLAELLKQAPAEITIDQLIEQFIEAHKEDREGQGFTLRIEREYGSTTIYLDKEERTPKYDCDFRISVDKEGEVYHLAFGRHDVDKKLFVGRLYGFERTIFQLYAAKSKLVIPADTDAHDYDTCFPSHYD
jgi:hypothetical protein